MRRGSARQREKKRKNEPETGSVRNTCAPTNSILDYRWIPYSIFANVKWLHSCMHDGLEYGNPNANHRSYQAIGNNITIEFFYFFFLIFFYAYCVRTDVNVCTMTRARSLAHTKGKYISLKYSNFSSFVYFSLRLSLYRKWIDHNYNWVCELWKCPGTFQLICSTIFAFSTQLTWHSWDTKICSSLNWMSCLKIEKTIHKIRATARHDICTSWWKMKR